MRGHGGAKRALALQRAELVMGWPHLRLDAGRAVSSSPLPARRMPNSFGMRLAQRDGADAACRNLHWKTHRRIGRRVRAARRLAFAWPNEEGQRMGIIPRSSAADSAEGVGPGLALGYNTHC
jgi:hypothetical protein